MSDVQNGASAADVLNVGSQSVQNEQSQVENESGDESQGNPEPQKVDVKKLNKLQLKVYGQDVEEELPFEIDENPAAVEYLTKQLQLAKAAQRAMQENSSFQKQVQDFLGGFKKDTRAALLQMGIDPKEFAASVIEEEIKKQQMSPEERERQELQDKIRKLEEERKSEKEQTEKQEYERLLQQEYEKVESQISTALESSGLPKSPYAIKKVADYMMVAAEKGVELSAADIAPIVREEIQKEMRELIAALDEDGAEEFIGKEIINKIRKKNLSRSKQTPASLKAQIKDVGQDGKVNNNEQGEKVTMKKFFGI